MSFVIATNTGTLLAVAGLLIADWIATAGRDPVLIASTSIGFGLLLGAVPAGDPVGLLATLYDAYKVAAGDVALGSLPEMLVGLAVAAVSAYVVIGALPAWLRRQTMTPFVIYRVLLGVLIFWLAFGSG